MSDRAQARIIGMGSYLPERVLSNADLEKLVDTSDEWIVSRTGMKERRIARPDESTSDMGAAAAKQAVEASGIRPEDIQLVIVATMTPDHMTPATAPIVQAKVGAVNAAAFDIDAACTGFIYGLSIAKGFIESGIYQNVLLVASEKMSSVIDYKDRNTCILFGDGAAAAVISNKGSGLAINSICLGADGSGAGLIKIQAGGSRQPATSETVSQGLHYVNMMGKEVFKHAVRRMEAAVNDCMAMAGLTGEEIDWLVPHQANLRIMEAMAKRANIPAEKVQQTVHKYGNTSASSIAIALHELTQEQQFREGAHFLLVAFGAGLTWGASILTKV